MSKIVNGHKKFLLMIYNLAVPLNYLHNVKALQQVFF